jgi:SEC-C motif-containing protein
VKGRSQDVACPCGGGAYAACCGKFHAGAVPQTAEALMRSRYSAYAKGLMDYVQASWHISTRPASLEHDEAAKWLGLEIRRHATHADAATVEFVARYRIEGRAHRLHETSRFVREDGRWFYLDGSFPEREE